MSVFFHGSFGLNRSHMSAVLRACITMPDKSDMEIAQPFGYKAPFTKKYKTWLIKTGIVNSGKGFRLTEPGRVIFDNDPTFQSTAAKWFLHHNLVSDAAVAETWYFFIYEFLPSQKSFVRADLQEGLAMKLMPHSAKHFASGSPMNKTISKKLLECYSGSEALGDLGLISVEGKDLYKVQKPKVIGPWASIRELEEAIKAT